MNKVLLALALPMTLALLGCSGKSIYVSPSGSDDALGTKEAPLASVQAALSKTAQLKAQDPQALVSIVLRGGEYVISDKILIDSTNAPLSIEAYEREKPFLRGDIDLKVWKAVKDSSVLAQLPLEAAGHVIVADLREAGIEDAGELNGKANRADLYYRGQRMKLAHWPNEGMARGGKTLGQTKLEPGWTKEEGTAEGIFEFCDDRIERWAKEPDFCMNGYWYWDWAESTDMVESVDAQKRTIKMCEPYHGYGYRDKLPFVAYNLLCELDEEGEYYIDRANALAYWYAPEGFDPAVEVPSYSVFSGSSMIDIKGCKGLSVIGLTLQGGRCDAIHIQGGENVLLSKVNAWDFGCNALKISGGKGHKVSGCDFHQLGCSGMDISGGDRLKLEGADYVVENTIVKDFSLFKHTYEPAIHFDGIGLNIRHNHFQGSTSSALRLDGNDVIVEYNEFFDLVSESDDQGGIDTYYDLSFRGNVVRYNYWKNIVGGSHCGAAGVRLDDMISGVKIYGNVFENVGAVNFGAVQIHGGKDNLVEDNLFYKCRSAVSFSPWSEARWKEYLEKPEVQEKMHVKTDITSEAWLQHYPDFDPDLEANVNRNFLYNNLAVGCQDLFSGKHLQGVNDERNNIFISSADEPLEHYLRANVLKGYGLKPIPFSQIGLQK